MQKTNKRRLLITTFKDVNDKDKTKKEETSVGRNGSVSIVPMSENPRERDPEEGKQVVYIYKETKGKEPHPLIICRTFCFLFYRDLLNKVRLFMPHF